MSIGQWLLGLVMSAALAAQPGAAPERFAYGTASSQFGELFLPQQTVGKAPVVVMVHGGCWQLPHSLDLMRPLAEDLRSNGVAVWNIEYRRLNESGSGYPGTFSDVGAAVDALRGLATRYPIDISHVAVVGHSAGGDLALWAAARPRLPAGSALKTTDPLPIGFAVTLAGIDDLVAYHDKGPACGGPGTIETLIDLRKRGPSAYGDTSPRALLPIGVEQLIVSGDEDNIVPAVFGRDYAAAATAAGDKVTAIELHGDNHFTQIDPASPGWAKVRERLLAWVIARK